MPTIKLSSVRRTVQLFRQLIDPMCKTVPCSNLRSTKPPFSPTRITCPLPRAVPESQGVPSAVIRRFLRALAANRSICPHEVLVLRNGFVLAQAYFGAQEPNMWRHLFSACKSVASLAVGILIGEGKLSLNTRVLAVLEKHAQSLAHLHLNSLTVEQLLTMTSGILFNEAEAFAEDDWLSGCLNAVLNGEPGKTFRYNSLNTYLLSAVVQEITHMSLAEFVRSRLFEPLGITQFHWETCPRGITRGGWGLYLQAEDLAKIAQLVMQRGRWNGRQLVPSEYVERAVTAQVSVPKAFGLFDYGYHIWRARRADVFLFNGMFGQNALGFRKNGIVIVMTAGNCDLFQTNAFFAQALRIFDVPFGSRLPAAPHAYMQLRRTIASFSHYRCHARGFLPRTCAMLNGMCLMTRETSRCSVGLLPLVLQISENNYTAGFAGLCFHVRGKVFEAEYREVDEVHRFPVGFTAPVVTQLTFHGQPFRVAVSGAFAHDADGRQVLKLRLDFTETPCTRFLRVIFEDSGAVLQQAERPDEQVLQRGIPLLVHGCNTKGWAEVLLHKMDTDYAAHALRRLFRPQLRLQKCSLRSEIKKM